jgi:two-component system phosphate regulon response regulator OmpR
MSPATSGGQSQPKQLLIVDDEPEIREMLQEFLLQMGYGVQVVETGRQALDLWTLPGIDGPDVMSQIRYLQPDCLIFAITGHADQVVTGSAVGTLVLEVFRKPFSLRALASRLSQHLQP